MRTLSFSARRFFSLLTSASASIVVWLVTIFEDTLISSHLLGETALAAYTHIVPIYSFMLFIGTAIAVGSSVCYTYEIGKLNKERAHCFFGQAVILAIIAGCILLGANTIGSGFVLGVMNPTAELAPYINQFMKWFPWVSLLIPLSCVLMNMVQADGDTRIVNLHNGILIIGNFLLSWILGGKYGMEGIVLGTFISSLVGLIILSLHFFQKQNSLRFKFHLNFKDTLVAFRFSAVEACEYLFLALLTFLLSQFVTRYFDENTLTTLSVMFEGLEMTVIFGGIWQAAEPLINIYRAEENAVGIRRLMHYVNGTAFFEGLFVTIGAFVCAPLLVLLFHIQTPELQNSTAAAIRIASLGLLALAFVNLYNNYYLHEHPWFAMFISVMRNLAVPVIIITLMGVQFGQTGLWVGCALAPIFTLGLCSLIFILKFGRTEFPLFLNEFDQNCYYQFDYPMTPAAIVSLRDQVAKSLTIEGVSPNIRMKAMLLIEEMNMAFIEKNKGKTHYGECSLLAKENSVSLILKNSGKLLDMTNLEMSVSNLRAYMVTSLMVYQEKRAYVLTTSYNRHVFEFPKA